MFYSQFILAKKGPLGTIWIAAHLERKLRKNQVADTDIGVSVDSILFPDVPIALRLSSHLLLGVVRIYNRKVNYLFDDCSEALLNVKQAFRSAAVDLPPEQSKAPYHSITLPETFDLDDFELPDNEIFHGNFVDHHISSREQITLQDTLDGVAYSTSKFGLDERFGDGDASGLDLDEELFLDKDGASGLMDDERSDPQASVGPMTPHKQDEHPEIMNADSGARVDDVDDYADLIDAQAPSTPGLVEEPNLPDVREVSACEDHMETEYPLGDSTVIENAENSTYGDKQEVDWSFDDNKSCDAVPMELPEENGHQSGASELDSSKLQGESPVEANTENVPIETLSGSKPPSDSIDKIADASQVAASNCHQDESFPQNRETEASGEPGEPNSSNLDVHEKMASSESPFLGPCNSNVEDPRFIPGCAVSADAAVPPVVTDLVTSGTEEMVMIGKDCSVADNPEEALQEGVDAASNETTSQVMIAGAHDGPVDNLNSSAENDLPAPEKLLSVPEDVLDQRNNIFADISPGEFVGIHASDDGSKVVSGKKRSFTESTLTEQSLHSVESSRLVRFKRTIDSVPDDDDLLSSILVGRSSVLKVKATPRPSVAASTKRTRSVQRSGAQKRKVLMDDTMVLHGDMIRRQLTHSEDIRRVRKKAPCTQSEISLIQKQFLEDEYFLGPLFAGASMELVSLHSRTWNLSGIEVCNNDPNDSLETGAEPRLPSENLPPEDGKDASPETIAATISYPANVDNDYHPTSQNAENCESLDAEGDKGAGNRNVAEENGRRITDSETPLLTDNGINEVHETNVEIDTYVKADVLRHEPLLNASGLETVDKNDDTSASVVQMDPTTETYEEALALVELDAPAGLPDQERDAGDGQGMESGFVNSGLETEPLPRDDILLDEAQGNATVELQSSYKQGQSELDEHNEMYSAMLGENVEYSQYTATQDYGFMENGRSPDQAEAHHHHMMGAESSGFDMLDQEEWKYSAAENDTDFLNVDDDELEEMADDHDVVDEEEARFMENTGWSSRTRAVSKYLQTLFVKEAEHGSKSLTLDHLLVGKTRKEASRMFFETLVLKTRDYIHVEQRDPFDGIAMKPRTRLMKSGF